MAATAVPARPTRRGRRRPGPRVGDERLVARVRAGDHAAFETIYDRYYIGLLAFCRHMLGSRDEAEDALQQSFASAYRALRSGTGVVDLRPWLYAIARNRCLSALRAQRDEVTVDGLDLGCGTFDGLPAEIALRAELRELVEDLQRLPDDQRAALVLFELGDQSHEQIAAVLDVRREKVKALVFQAREALLRARRAREASCAEIREQIASLTGDVPRRGMLRSHIDRCPGCAAFELEVRHQRAAFAAILPVAPSVGLKGSVLALFGGGGAAAAGGVSAGAGAGAGTAAVAGSVAAGGTTVGIASLGAKAVVTKALAVVALAGGATGAKVHKEHAPAPTAAYVSHQVSPPRYTQASGTGVRAAATRGAPATSPHHRRPKVARHHDAAAKAPAPAPTAPVDRPVTPVPQDAPPTPQVKPGAAPPPVPPGPPPVADSPTTQPSTPSPPPPSSTPTPSAPAPSDAAPHASTPEPAKSTEPTSPTATTTTPDTSDPASAPASTNPAPSTDTPTTPATPTDPPPAPTNTGDAGTNPTSGPTT